MAEERAGALTDAQAAHGLEQQVLHALIEWFYDYPLKEESENVFAFPDFGLYHGEKLIFTRDKTGRATQVEAASVRVTR